MEPVTALWRGKRYSAHDMTAEIVGCKWTLHILAAIGKGIVRPGELVRACEGISTKVLNERLSKLLAFGVLRRVELGEKRQHVEYHLTARGEHLGQILRAVDQLQELMRTER